GKGTKQRTTNLLPLCASLSVAKIELKSSPKGEGFSPIPREGQLGMALSMTVSYRILLQMLAVVVFSAALAFLVNEARENRLPLIMPFPPEYRCPSGLGAVPFIAPESALKSWGRSDTLFVDARSEEEFQRGHIEGSLNIPYLHAEFTSAEVLDRLRAYKMVIIYCNTRDARLSRLMCAELVQAGIGGATYLQGGGPAWVAAGGKYAGQRPLDYEEIP
ncbi:MAG: rhodanese-like domain-containing protein, partial [Deltaproteobacteria bacterium]|nr:rhodanese-like domain-containing protein [Deltaproteobacteria bacterium]